MANHKSAEKRARQNDKRRERNTGLRARAKTEVRKALETLEKATTLAEGLKALAIGERALQKAVSKGVMPKTRASRKTGRLAAELNKKFKAQAASKRA